MLASTAPSVVIPRFDSGMIRARVEIPPGTPVLQADRVLQQMSARIRETPEVEGVFTSMNGADGSAPDANIFIQLTDRDERDRSAYAIQQVLRPVLAEFPDYRFIGLLMLMGLGTKDSILLVDFAVERMHAGMSRNAALMGAGMKRARPIIMTTFAMSGGMIPAAAGWGVDGTLRQGMGAAVIGGLMLSTLLSLVFVPAMFVLIDRLERWVRGFLPKPHAREERAPSETPAE